MVTHRAMESLQRCGNHEFIKALAASWDDEKDMVMGQTRGYP